MAERKSRQLTPAKFGRDATNIGQPDLSSTMFSKQGIVDEGQRISSAAATNKITAALDVAGDNIQDLKKGFALGRLEQEQKNEIDAFFNSRDPNNFLGMT